MIQNPILKGFASDPSIIRVGDDFYIATATFEWWPGVRLWHSKDLASWEMLPSPLQKKAQIDLRGVPNNCGIWSPQLSYDGKHFYLVYSFVKTQKKPYCNCCNFVITADKIDGKWSNPVYLNSTGYDASIFHDDDGASYLLNMLHAYRGIVIQPFDTQNLTLFGEPTCIFNGTDAKATRAPRLFKKRGWYYLLCAEGGHGYAQQETLARSQEITGPYETYPIPFLSAEHYSSLALQKAGLGSLVETAQDELYFVHSCCRPLGITSLHARRSPLGRETAIQKIRLTPQEWLITDDGAGLPRVEVAEMRNARNFKENQFVKDGELFARENEPCRDDFLQKNLGVQYLSLREPLGKNASLSARKSFLRLYGNETITSNFGVSLVARRLTDFYCDAECAIDFAPQNQNHVAGLSLFYNNENFYLAFISADSPTERYLSCMEMHRGEYRYDEDSAMGKIMLPQSGTVFLQYRVRGNNAQIYYSLDSKTWQLAFSALDVTLLSDEYCDGLTGTQVALYCHDLNKQGTFADFDYFSLTPSANDYDRYFM